MSDGLRSKASIIALSAAGVALATSIGAVVFVLTRDSAPAPSANATGGSASSEASGSASAPSSATGGVVDLTIRAADVLKLKQRDLVEDASAGVQVTDAALRTALQLGPDDVITAIGGRTVMREFDLFDAMMGLTVAETTTVYVELRRAGNPVLARWKLDVSMRVAWRTSLAGSGGVTSNPFLSSRPPPTADPDPALVDAIVKVDDTNVEAPRAAVDAVFGFTVRGVRAVPSIKNGIPAGVKLYAIRPTSIYAAMGFTNGDTIQMLDNRDVTDVDKLIEVYGTLKTAPRLKVEIQRRGRPLTLTIVVK